MKIYTKTGDNGTTSLYGGTRVSKHHIRIESYGTLDELNSHLGLLRDQINTTQHKDFLLSIQHDLFVIGAYLATEKKKEEKLKIDSIGIENTECIEKEIDNLNKDLPLMTHFILPGGHIMVSQCHVARSVCRRAERLIVLLQESEEVDPNCIKYINRLSDYLFVLARKLSQEVGAEEIKWIPKKSL